MNLTRVQNKLEHLEANLRREGLRLAATDYPATLASATDEELDRLQEALQTGGDPDPVLAAIESRLQDQAPASELSLHAALEVERARRSPSVDNVSKLIPFMGKEELNRVYDLVQAGEVLPDGRTRIRDSDEAEMLRIAERVERRRDRWEMQASLPQRQKRSAALGTRFSLLLQTEPWQRRSEASRLWQLRREAQGIRRQAELTAASREVEATRLAESADDNVIPPALEESEWHKLVPPPTDLAGAAEVVHVEETPDRDPAAASSPAKRRRPTARVVSPGRLVEGGGFGMVYERGGGR